MAEPSNVGQPFQAAGDGGFPAAVQAKAVVGSESPRSNLIAGFHSRDHLPHVKREGASYFVTFRLAGTLPQKVLRQFKMERERILRHALAGKRPLTWFETMRILGSARRIRFLIR